MLDNKLLFGILNGRIRHNLSVRDSLPGAFIGAQLETPVLTYAISDRVNARKATELAVGRDDSTGSTSAGGTVNVASLPSRTNQGRGTTNGANALQVIFRATVAAIAHMDPDAAIAAARTARINPSYVKERWSEQDPGALMVVIAAVQAMGSDPAQLKRLTELVNDRELMVACTAVGAAPAMAYTVEQTLDTNEDALDVAGLWVAATAPAELERAAMAILKYRELDDCPALTDEDLEKVIDQIRDELPEAVREQMKAFRAVLECLRKSDDFEAMKRCLDQAEAASE